MSFESIITIPNMLLRGDKFNGTHIKVYAYVLEQAYLEQNEYASFSNSQIGEHINRKPKTVSNAINHLVKKGVFGYKRKHDGDRVLYIKSMVAVGEVFG